MKTFYYLITLVTLFFNFNAHSQCSAAIDIPSAAIANCGSTQINSTATGPGPYQYSWSSPTIIFSSTTIANPTISSTTTGWQTVTLLVVDNNNCTSIVTDSIQFFNHVDTIYQTYCSLPDSVCTVLPSLTNGGWAYTDTSGVSSMLPTTDCVAIVGPGSYEFTGVLVNFCTVSHTFIVTEDCGTGCTALIDAPAAAITNCASAQVFGTGTGSGLFEYTWSSPTITFFSDSISNPSILSAVSGWQTFTLTVTDGNNCTSAVTDSIEFYDYIDTIYQTYCALPDSVCILEIPTVQILGWTYTDTLGVMTTLPPTECVQVIGPGEYEFSGVYNFSCTVQHTYIVTEDCGTGSGCSAAISAPAAGIANCGGSQVFGTATGPGPYQYSWSSPTITFSSTSIANPTISSTTTGWQTVTLLVVDNNNCTSIVTDSIQFFNYVDTIYQSYCALPDSVCTVLPSMTNGGWTYTDTSGVSSMLPTNDCVAIVGPGSYEFTGVLVNFCTVSHTFIVTEDCGTGCTATITAPDVAISNCIGPQISATATGSGPYQYLWSSSNGLTFSSTTDANPYISSTVPGWYYYSVLIVDANNCTSFVEDSVEFFDPGASFDVTYCSLPDTICAIGSPVSLLGWDYTDTNGVTTALGATACVSIVGPGTYEFFGIYESNCTVIHTYYVTQDCGTGCSATINAPSEAISNCVGPQISATATGPGPYQYTWSSPSLTFSSTTVADPYISATVPGWYYYSVLIVDVNNCTSLVTDSVQFFEPVDTIYQTYCTLPDSVCVLDIPINSFLGWTYTHPSGTTTNLPSTDCVAIVGPGIYEFTGVYESNCTVIHTYVISEDCGNVGIDEVLDENEPFIYPNPATSEINVRLPSSKCDRWEIVDLFGKTCLSGSSDQGEFKIQLQDIADGTYFVRIYIDDSVSNSMLIKN